MALSYTILHKNRIFTKVDGALSHTYADQDEYDTTNYRNLFDSTYMGRAWAGGALPDPFVSPGAPESKDDQFTDTPPHPELKKRTKLIIWSGAAGTGNVLFEGWADRIESFSIGTYETL